MVWASASRIPDSVGFHRFHRNRSTLRMMHDLNSIGSPSKSS